MRVTALDRPIRWMTSAVLVCAIAGAAADTGTQRFSFGARVGLGGASFYGDDADDADMETRAGYTFGFIGAISLADMFAFRPEFAVTFRGARFDSHTGTYIWGTYYSADMEGLIRLTYIEVPLLLQWHLPGDRPVSPLVFAGASLAANIDARQQVEWDIVNPLTGTTEHGDDEEDIDDITVMDVGVVGGGGVAIQAGSGDLLLEGRFVLGLVDIYEDSDMRTWTVGVDVGYRW